MESASLVLLSNQTVLERAMDVVANNVANASTTGFKREGIEFDTLLSQPTDGQSLDFVMDRATYRDTSNGPIEPTGNPLDLAIQGAGYFEVQTAGGIRYTRAGALHINSEDTLVDASGDPVMSDGNQAISIPDSTTEINVAGDGFITARTDNGTSLAELGKIALVKFTDEKQLQAQGGGLYTTAEPPQPADNAIIVQHALEQSNVEPVTEITNMIRIMRSYEQVANMISNESTRLNNAIDKLSKTTA